MSDAPILAAGVLTWRVHHDTLQVLLVHRPRYNDWSIPKGKAEPGEDLRTTAVRELAEETGVAVALGAPLAVQRYTIKSMPIPKEGISSAKAAALRAQIGKDKEVHYWVGTPLASTSRIRRTRPAVHPASDDEIDGVRWVSIDDARRLLSRESDRLLLDKAAERYEDGTLETAPTVIFRHSKALRRERWTGTDALRPLTASGLARAKGAVEILSSYGIQRIYSSPWVRCVETVKPFAKATQGRVVPCPELTEAAYEKKPKRARETMRLLLERQARQVICVHRPTLPGLLAVIRDYCGRRASAVLPTEDPYLRTGEMLVLHVAGGPEPRIVFAEKVRPPEVEG